MSRRTPTSWLAFAAVLLAVVVAKGQQPVFVKPNATGANDGTTWVNAYTDLQTALLAEPGQEIWVAKGTYVPFGPRTASFVVASGTRVFGGFNGTEVQRNQRKPEANPTILSGDRNGDDVLYFGNLLDNCFHVVTASGTDAETLIDGLRITGGYTFSGPTEQEGAGLRVENGSLQVRDCRFEINVAKYGGAIAHLGSGALLVEKSRFKINEVRYGRGAAIHVGEGVDATVRDSHFEKNHATGGSEVGRGGGINADEGSTLVVESCVFIDNDAVFGCCSGVAASSGGAIHTSATSATISDCRFLKNESHNGGAIGIAGAALLVDNEFSGNFAVAELGWGGYGGAIWVDVGGNATVKTSTVSRNLGTTAAGGIYVEPGGQASVSTSILWNNFDIRGFFSQSQIEGATASHSCIQNMLTPAPGYPAPSAAMFPGSTSANPLFRADRGADNLAGTLDDDLRLDPASPCIDTGAPGSTAGLDVAGRLRVIDGDFDAQQRVDMGAHEFNNVELMVTTAPVAGGTQWTIGIETQSPMPAFLVFGLQRPEVNIAPYGAIWFNSAMPFAMEFVGYGTDTVLSSFSPPSVPPVPVTFQALVIGGAQVGNFSIPQQEILH